MTTNRRKRNVKFRGTRTCGAGTKKRRGSGNRGGKGMAGTGKRADHKKPTIINEYGNTYFGRHKLIGPERTYKAVNIDLLDRKIDSFSKKGKAELKANTYTMDLSKIGAKKLLGSGDTNKKMKITVDMASENAIEKIKKAGGDVIVRKTKLPEKATEADKA